MSIDYFPEYEYECNCGCGEANLSPSFKLKINEARELAGIPFTINAGCCCEDHREEAGHSETSSHLASPTKKACAFDIHVGSSHARFVILMALIKVGFTRIGIAKTFIHVDDDTTKPPSVSWVY